MPLSQEAQQRVHDWGAAALPLLSHLMGEPGQATHAELLDAYNTELARNLPPKEVAIARVDMDGIPAAVLTPEKWRDGRTMLYIHGGGYISGGADGYHGIAGHYARELGARVYVPDYRLAPEAPFPAALDDTIQTYAWLVGEVGADKIVIAGDSAGGAMVVTLQVRARNSGIALPVAGVAISPWADLEMPGASYVTREGIDPLCTRDVLKAFVRPALGTGLANNPEVSPVNADVRGLSPVLVQVGGAEVMMSDAMRLATHLADHGNRASLEVWPEMFHVWPMFSDVVPEGREAIETGAAFLSRFLEKAAKK
ncbi:alpha/beta hydrolase [Tritonibacter mobilis]|nr:alpha/beta hydrolase [Tritonibacter mobilis]